MSFPPVDPPYSTLFVLLLALAVSFLTSLANRLLSNPEKSKVWRKEISEWNSELRKAQKEGDKKTLDKVMKRQKEIMQLQSKMMWQSMKVTLLFIVPLFLIWQFLGSAYVITVNNVPSPAPVAYFPGFGAILPIPIFQISLIWWYLLSSMLFGTVFSHVFGLTEISE